MEDQQYKFTLTTVYYIEVNESWFKIILQHWEIIQYPRYWSNPVLHFHQKQRNKPRNSKYEAPKNDGYYQPSQIGQNWPFSDSSFPSKDTF